MPPLPFHSSLFSRLVVLALFPRLGARCQSRFPRALAGPRKLRQPSLLSLIAERAKRLGEALKTGCDMIFLDCRDSGKEAREEANGLQVQL
jgi:hypothetical protein